ncbi:MAG: hypothetical protein M3153_06930 [Chloroflexota bacterium]|nr:hypothetical protein [Chloroflexota bacterium]
MIDRRLAAASLLLVLAGCAGLAPDDPVSDRDPGPPSGDDSSAVLIVSEGNRGGDAGMTVADALAHQATDDLVLVSGALFVDADGGMLLCDAVAESFPPQCGGARLAVESLDLASIDGLEEANGVRWAENVVLFGSVE